MIGQCTGLTPTTNYRWTRSTGFQGLPLLAGTSTLDCVIKAVSGDGATEGGYCDVFGTGATTATPVPVRWTGTSAPVNLGLPATPPTFSGEVLAMNNNGTMLTGWVNLGSSSSVPGLWRTGQPAAALGILSGATGAQGFAISDDGTVVAGLVILGGTPEYPIQASFRWTSAGMVQIPFLMPGGTTSSGAKGMTPDGVQIVGQGDTNNQSQFDAYLYNSNTKAIVPLIAPGATYAFGSVISADGTTIGGVGDNGVWLSTNGATPVLLATTLANLGVDLTGIQLDAITGISSDGKVVVGSSFDGSNDYGFIAVLK
jgi:uncharacterized membrane protein